MTRSDGPAARSLLAVDGGQSITKLRFRGHDGVARDAELPGIRTDRPLLPQLIEITRSARERFGAFDTAAFGVSGLVAAESDPAPILRSEGAFGLRRAGLAHDSVTAYLAAQGTRSGVVVAAGTGVVTLAVGPTGFARVDGWGWIMGDAGSGFWIGRAALDAVMRAYDRRGPATALTDAVREVYPDLPSAYIELQADPDRVSRVASFAAAVGATAGGDDVARAILVRAADELVHSALTAWDTVAEGAPAVRTIGGVFRSPVVFGAFADGLRALRPGADVDRGNPHGLDGVEALAGLHDVPAFDGLVAWAEDDAGL